MLKIFIEHEDLNEMATIFKNKEQNISVVVNPDSNRSGNPYFKFVNNSNFRNADKIIRILFNRPDYVIHHDGKELWELNSKEKKLLIAVMNKESSKYRGYTNWQAAKFDWNYEYFEEDWNIDDYFAGKYDKDFEINPGFIVSTLKMPDYTKITF